MLGTRAAHNIAPVRRGRRGSFGWSLLLVAAFACLQSVAAQQAPTLSLGSYSYIVGETLTLYASELEPGGSYRVELSPPTANGEPGAPQVSVLTATDDGTLRYTAPLQNGGTYQVRISGPRLDASLNVQVSGAEAAVGQAPRGDPDDGEGEEGSAGATEAGEAPGDAPDAPAEEDAPAAPDEEETPEAESDAATEAEREGAQEEQPADEPTEEPIGEPADEPADERTDEAADPLADEPADGAGPDEEADEEPSLTLPGDADDGGPDLGAPRPGVGAPERPGTSTPRTAFDVQLDGNSVQATLASGATLWRLDFPEGSGRTAGLARQGDRLVVGHGNHLLELAPETGQVVRRHRLPAQVVDIELGGAAAEVTVEYMNGVQRRVRVTEEGPAALQPFDPDPELYAWLRVEANVTDPARRVEQDPTNPWLYVAQARSAPSADLGTDDLLREAIANAVTFYERAQLADALLNLPDPRPDLAQLAMDAALDDFVARGYRAELLTNDRLADAYGFPQGRLINALGRGDLARAEFWADWLYRTSSKADPDAQAALREYARYLQEAGRSDEASLWRARANEGGGFQVGAALTNAARTVGRTGWYGVAALVVSILALHITLLAKYWRPQTLNMRRAREAGRSVSPVLARLTFMRYATFVEKLVVVLLFAAALALTALQGWALRVDAVPPAWGSGSLATPPALAAVAAADSDNPDALFVRGFAAQSVDNASEAEAAYRQLADDPAALNNLAVLLRDESLLERALALAPDDEVVLFNLGRAPNPSPLLSVYAEDEPMLVAPDAARVGNALAGSYLDALAGAFTNPWSALTTVEGVTWAAWVWTIVVVIFLLWAGLSIVFLLLPRPRLARNAPRTPLYHLLALLLPGTGLADEFWGVFLMVPWAIFGVDFLLNYLPAGPDPTMALRTDGIALIVIYVLNTVAFFVEFASYRRRMASLKENDPQTAREYGMRVPTPEFG